MLIKEIKEDETAQNAISGAILMSALLKDNEKCMVVVEMVYKSINGDERTLRLTITKDENDYFYNFHVVNHSYPSTYTLSEFEDVNVFIHTTTRDVLDKYFNNTEMGMEYKPTEDRVINVFRVYKYHIRQHDNEYTKLRIKSPDYDAILKSKALRNLFKQIEYEKMVVTSKCICPVDDIQLTFRIDIEKNIILRVPHFSLCLSKYNNNDMGDNFYLLDYDTLSRDQYDSENDLYDSILDHFQNLIKKIDELSHACAIGEVTIESYLLRNNKINK